MDKRLVILDKTLTILILTGSVFLVICYFLPFEADYWSPLTMTLGYPIAGGSLSGPSVAIYSTAPYILGLIILIATLLRRWIRVTTFILITYSAIWLTGVIMYLFTFFQLPRIQFRFLWLVIALVSVTLLVLLLFISFNYQQKQNVVNSLMLIMAGGCLLQIAVDIAYCLLEDQLLLNYGAVASVAAAVVLVISLLFRYIVAMPITCGSNQVTNIPR